MHADETKVGKIGKVSKSRELFNNIIKLAFIFLKKNKKLKEKYSH